MDVDEANEEDDAIDLYHYLSEEDELPSPKVEFGTPISPLVIFLKGMFFYFQVSSTAENVAKDDQEGKSGAQGYPDEEDDTSQRSTPTWRQAAGRRRAEREGFPNFSYEEWSDAAQNQREQTPPRRGFSSGMQDKFPSHRNFCSHRGSVSPPPSMRRSRRRSTPTREEVVAPYPYGPQGPNVPTCSFPPQLRTPNATARRPQWAEELANNGQFIDPRDQMNFCTGIDATRFNLAAFAQSMAHCPPKHIRPQHVMKKTCVLITDGGVSKILMTKPENCIMGRYDHRSSSWGLISMQGFDASHMFGGTEVSDQWEIFQVSLVGLAMGANGVDDVRLSQSTRHASPLWKKVSRGIYS